MKIGLKTVVSIVVMFLSLLTCAWVLVTSPHVFWDMEPRVGFTIGVFAVIFSHFFSKFWEVDERSHYALFITKGELRDAEQIGIFSDKNLSVSLGPARELVWEIPTAFIKVCYFLAFFAISITLIDNRSLFLAYNFPNTIKGSDEFCPEEVEKPKKMKIKPGCDLVMKAYEMGYAKNLGDCDPRLGEDGKKVEEPKICEKRRKDEPYPHYAFRLLERFYDRTFPDDISGAAANSVIGFIKKTEKADILAKDQTKSLVNTPRSSHNIFTNLPHPNGVVFAKFKKYLPEETCQEKIANAPSKYIGDPKDYAAESSLLEHTFGKLLFSQTHEPAAGYCPDYTIQWDAPEDSCAQLAENPEVFLESVGLKKDVEDVLSRMIVKQELTKLKLEIGELSPNSLAVDKTKKNTKNKGNLGESNDKGKPVPEESNASTISGAVASSDQGKDPAEIEDAIAMITKKSPESDLPRYVSFQCITRDGDIKEVVKREHMFSYLGAEFKVVELRVPQIEVDLLTSGESFRTDYYDHLSQLFAKNFSNVGFESKANVLDDDINDLAKEIFKDNRLLLTKLQLLEHVDIFQEQDWIKSETGILDIYPWQLHEANFVERFRTIYKTEKGRL